MKRLLSIIVLTFAFISASTIIGFAEESQSIEVDNKNLNSLSESNNETVVYKERITGGEIFFDKGTGMVTNCRGNVTKIVLPEKIEGVTVEGIDEKVFKECTSLKNVELADGIQTIENEAFYGCTELETIKLSDSLKIIGDGAFSECKSLIDIEIPDSVTKIGHSAFYECISLKSVKLSDNIGTIDYNLFEYCSSLTSIIIPDSVKFIEYGAFRECNSLKQVELSKNLKTIDDHAFEQCIELQSIKIPEGVTSIGKSAFWRCLSLRYISLPNTLTIIDSYAFQNCKKIRRIKIPEGVKTIDRLFDGCSSLKSIEIPSSVEYIELERPLNESLIDYELLIIYGKRGTEAHKYAVSRGIAFIVGKMPETESIEGFEININSNCSYNGKGLTPSVTVSDEGYELEEGIDYIISYENNTRIGTALAIIKGIGNYSGSVEKTFQINPPQIKAPKILTSYLYGYDDFNVSWSSQKVDGATVKYKVEYKKNGGNWIVAVQGSTATSVKVANLADGTDYTFRVTPYVTIGEKDYYGTSKATSPIYTLKKLNKPSVKKSSKKYVKVSWNNIPGETGYQIAKSTKKTKGFKVVKKVSYKYKTAKIKVSRNKNYYYKVRAYKTTNVNGKNVTVYGPWSSVKSYKLR